MNSGGAMSNIVILSGSPRKGGNTDLLVQAFAEGAEERNTVEIISVTDYTVHPCSGCNACMQTEGHACVRQDDMERIYERPVPYASQKFPAHQKTGFDPCGRGRIAGAV